MLKGVVYIKGNVYSSNEIHGHGEPPWSNPVDFCREIPYQFLRIWILAKLHEYGSHVFY